MGAMGILFFIGLLVCLITFITGLFLQEQSKSGIFYGVSLPEGYEKRPEFKALGKKYKVNFCISYAIYCAGFLALLYNYPNPAIMIIGILVFLIVINGNYLYIHYKVKTVKKNETWQIPKRSIVVVDTNFRKNKRMLISSWWFSISIAIILLNIIISLIYYGSLPPKIPTHWGIEGQVDKWVDRTYLNVLMQPVVSALMTSIMFVSYKIVGRAKQQLNPDDIEGSREKNRIFRYVWSAYFVGMSIVLVLLFTFTQFNVLMIIKSSPAAFAAMTIIILSTALVSIVLSLVLGQGGSRLKLVNKKDGENIIVARDDDKHWIFGDLYYNPDDPSLFVEKRVGVGWDLNYARPAAKIIISLIILLIAGIVIFTVYMTITNPM